MEDKKIEAVKALLYNTDIEVAKESIIQMNDSEQLYLYAYNYNWDNGFDIPQLVLDNESCELSIALLIFYRADGIGYLIDKSDNENLPKWSSFIECLYESILRGKYPKGKIGFKNPLSEVEKYKLKKQITKEDSIFIEDIAGESLDIE
ncbi:DUF4274 domain-containing protein [Butyrivibrio sp. X503]|uniref:DUF4274 domain-containing protein n=1 Tax=Butyrivibrio sp. X503 TaxID=2364878 RepID=UPI000EA89D43|nr:DUF4274 domain-containing protein [Butyrivibrio sp. X503]RKM58182.1 DUF4274 domain-containing protein [Butyrivibrio sp. X503]